ncbi:MAG: hypothetical protein KAH32_08670, partial [Chlamydiia bacterium]|nr:hypothetical protein [Chlamydiia bacterium]
MNMHNFQNNFSRISKEFKINPSGLFDSTVSLLTRNALIIAKIIVVSHIIYAALIYLQILAEQVISSRSSKG